MHCRILPYRMITLARLRHAYERQYTIYAYLPRQKWADPPARFQRKLDRLPSHLRRCVVPWTSYAGWMRGKPSLFAGCTEQANMQQYMQRVFNAYRMPPECMKEENQALSVRPALPTQPSVLTFRWQHAADAIGDAVSRVRSPFPDFPSSGGKT